MSGQVKNSLIGTPAGATGSSTCWRWTSAGSSNKHGQGTYAGPVEVHGAVVVIHVNWHRGRRGKQPLDQVLRVVDQRRGDNREATTAVHTDPVAQALVSDQVGDVLREPVGREVPQQGGFEREKHATAEAHEDVLGVDVGGGFVQHRFDRERPQAHVSVGDTVAADFGVAGEKVRDGVGAGERIERALEGVRGRRAEVYRAGGGRKHSGAWRGGGSHCVVEGVVEGVDEDTGREQTRVVVELTPTEVEEQRNVTTEEAHRTTNTANHNKWDSRKL